MNNEIVRLMHFLEFSDSAFPVGTFSFSNGLESAAFEGIVHDVPTLEAYTRTAVMQTVHSDAIAALIAFRAIGDNDYELVKEADAQVMQCKMNTEARLMLTRMGKKMAEIGSRIANCPVMDRWLEDIRNQRVAGTYPISQAIFFQQNGLSEQELFATIEYGIISMIVNAALRCIKVSHYATQAILFRLSTKATEDYERVKDMGFEDMRTFAPEMDIIVSLHEKGKMRMFMN